MPGRSALPHPVTDPGPRQELRFCTAPDGVRIAYAVHGEGPPLVISTCWLSHLQHDWESPVWRHFLEFLGSIATVVRFDERGFGLSEREIEDFSLEARIGDLEAVVEAAGFDRFSLMAMAQGGAVAISYAHRHPERVERLVFYGSSAVTMPDPTPDELDQAQVFDDMVRVGWARPDSTFRRVFTTLMIPDGGEREMRWLDELQRLAVTPETLVRARVGRRDVDVRPLLKDLSVPALIMHSRHDRMHPFAKSVELASAMPDARFTPLECDNHIVLEDDAAWQIFVSEMLAFLPRPEPEAAAASTLGIASLSPRERDVLVLAAEGLDNDGIAEALTLSVRTVERHLQNAYLKLEVRGKSARAAAVARYLNASRR
ncbi:alpha/beta fold hydrolase [Nocardioides speluncae]|uniref:alpha/beta fold hydrolase n=1 Tax=Nocardioides speluncae TaxID=2670337 RepID=UPI000D69AA8A|nr:alpha/beta fold hydrolase [Nocardioides speluncae]